MTVILMNLHKEIRLEEEICEHLAAHGWLYTEGDAAQYDRSLALFPADVLAWVMATQPKAWETLIRNHGPQAGAALLSRLREQIDTRGTLDVLRHGVELIGLRHKLPLAQFKPALAMNPETMGRYAANRLRVVRQDARQPESRANVPCERRQPGQSLPQPGRTDAGRRADGSAFGGPADRRPAPAPL